MKLQSVLTVTAVAGMAASASAQFFGAGVTASASLTFVDQTVTVVAGSIPGNGIVEPGERALILMNISFNHQSVFGTPDTDNPGYFFSQGGTDRQSFAPGVGTATSGFLRGLGLAYLDLRSGSADPFGSYNGGITSPTGTSVGPNANNAGTTGFGVRGGWRLGGNGANGSPVANGFANIGPGQLPNTPDLANQTNPIVNMERLSWLPTSYATRTVNFAVSPAAGAGTQAVGIYTSFGDMEQDTTVGSPTFGEWTSPTPAAIVFIPLAQVSFGNINIPLAPAPSSLALLGLGGLIAGRRRR